MRWCFLCRNWEAITLSSPTTSSAISVPVSSSSSGVIWFSMVELLGLNHVFWRRTHKNQYRIRLLKVSEIDEFWTSNSKPTSGMNRRSAWVRFSSVIFTLIHSRQRGDVTKTHVDGSKWSLQILWGHILSDGVLESSVFPLHLRHADVT